jgi:hypothetical protein
MPELDGARGEGGIGKPTPIVWAEPATSLAIGESLVFAVMCAGVHSEAIDALLQPECDCAFVDD